MKDVTDGTFAVEVMDRSKEVPVVVDLWAPWCQPCKALGPILEKVVNSTEGKIDLVKINIDENPQVAQSFQVQSIPAVFGIKDGEVVDAFMGAKGEAEVTEFIEGLLPTGQEEILDELLEDASEASLEEVLQAYPDHVEAVTKLAKIYVESNRSEEALDLLKKIPESAETRHIAAQARTGDISDSEVLKRLDELLLVVKGDDSAREEFVDLLDVLGPDNAEVANYRKKLSREIY